MSQRESLAELRDRLARVDELPAEERPGVFEAAHRALAEELAALEEV